MVTVDHVSDTDFTSNILSLSRPEVCIFPIPFFFKHTEVGASDASDTGHALKCVYLYVALQTGEQHNKHNYHAGRILNVPYVHLPDLTC